MFLPKKIEKVKIPPLKCQGIKSKLVPFIASSVSWDGEGTWIEPFLGSGVVAFNILPQRALLCDSNTHIVQLYQDIQSGVVTHENMRSFLELHSKELTKGADEYYKQRRNHFNEHPNSFDFIFLNRSCFNGLMRFNKKGGFNVPFGKKPKRFSKAYITKICNQIKWLSLAMKDKDWTFLVQDWKETLEHVSPTDFIYLDPPYIGRHTDYYNQWDQKEADALAEMVKQLACSFAYSMWIENKYRKNEHIIQHWENDENFTIATMEHFYHVGSKESLRNGMLEGLIMKK